MATIGFAHRTSAPSMNPDLLAYLDAGGTLDDLCGLAGDTQNGAGQNCDACRLGDTLMCPHHVAAPYTQHLTRTDRMRVIAQLRHHAKPLDPSQLTRAPPQA
ncbi:hypothetical protein [Roseobacter sp.]|uniref:hypothetical protein n=1 Tax=Roseobacter sp. TaxID=1907202 RepID=UPI00329853B5